VAVLGRLLIGSQQRVDLPDLLSLDSYTASDFRYLIKSFIGDVPLVLKGFEIIDAPQSIGTSSVSIKVSDSVLFNASSTAGSFFYGLPEGDPLSAPLVPELRLNATNYVYLTLSSVGKAQDTRAFWDVDLNGGEGGEFNQDVNTESVLMVDVNVSVSTFPEGTIPIAKITLNSSVITDITDCRDMMFRLGSGGVNPNPNSTFNFRSLPSATYKRDEPVPTITSSAAPSPFFGGDKNIYNLKEWMDAVMTKLLELSGTTFWYESTPTMSLLNLFSDSLGTSIKSKGKWTHDISTPGKVTWSEDIVIRKMNDPRDIIVRANATTGITLADDQVMWINMIRDVKINPLDTPVSFVSGAAYVNGSAGLFVNLSKGDWIKRHGDDDNLYLRVEEFKDALNGGGSVTTAANAVSVILSATYAGSTITDNAVYTKGEYLNTDIQVTNRAAAAAFQAGGNFFWLANRSDTIENVAGIVGTQFASTVDISDSDGVRARLTFPSVHGLVDGDRIVLAGAGGYNGTFQVDVESTTTVMITTAAVSNPTGITASWAVVTTAARSTAYSYQLESAAHNFESNQTVTIAGTSSLYDSYQGGQYQINNRSATTFQIPYNAATTVGAGGTADGAKVNLRTEFGAARVIQGESVNINEPDTDNILSYIGMDSLSQTSPVYQTPSGYNTLAGFQDFNSSPNDNLTVRASKLTAMMADRVQDRGIEFLGRLNFRNVGSGANQVVSVSGSMTIVKPGSPSQVVTLGSSFTLAANQALVATISREGSGAITPAVESLGSPFLLEENKFVLFSRFGTDSVYGWDGQEIKNSSSWTIGDHETSQSKNIIVQDLAGVAYDNVSNVFSFNSALEDVYIIIPGSANNIVDVSAINALSTGARTVNDDQSVWVRINRAAAKTFTITSFSSTFQDSDAAGALYITNTSSVPTDQDVFVLYSVRNGVLIQHNHFDPAGNIYEEDKVGVLIPTTTYEFTAPLTAPQILNLPADSRDAGSAQLYVVGSGQLQMFLNGQRLREGVDFTEVGTSGSLSNQIQMEQDLVVDDVLTFRVDGHSAVYFTPSPSTTTTLQDAYDNGNIIAISTGSPITLTGTGKLLNVIGDMTVTGVIDPQGITFSLEASNPLPSGEHGLYIDTNGHLIQYRPLMSPSLLNITDAILNPSSFLGAGDGLSYSGANLQVNTGTTGGLEINSDIVRVKLPTDSGLGRDATGLYINIDNDSLKIIGNVLQVGNASALFVVLANNSGSTIPAGSLVSADVVAGQIVLATANNLNNAEKYIGVVLNDILNGASGKVQIAGVATPLGGPYTLGSPVFLSTTAGQATSSVPLTSGTAQYIVGVAVSATDIMLQAYLQGVVGTLYEEYVTLGAPSLSGSTLTLPMDSRAIPAAVRNYIVGTGDLEFYVNGQKLKVGDDYTEQGAPGAASNTITILQDLVSGDVLCYRIPVLTSSFNGGSFSDPMTTAGDTMYRNNSNVTTRLPAGSIGQVFTVISAGVIGWANNPAGFSDPMTTAGDLIYRNPGNTTARLGAGAIGSVLGVTAAGTLGWTASVQSASTQSIALTNNSGSTIPAFKPVRVDAGGDITDIDVSVEVQAKGVVGVTTASIADTASGEIVTSGRIENITGSFTFGDILYIDKNGDLSNVVPDIGAGSPAFIAGDFVVKIGVVTKNQTTPANMDLILQIQVLGQL
jgi:hypothetical protein